MRRLEQNGEILIRALLISGLVIGMTQIVGIHPVTGQSQNPDYNAGWNKGLADCNKGNDVKNYDPGSGDQIYLGGYEDGWIDEGCTKPDTSKNKK